MFWSAAPDTCTTYQVTRHNGPLLQVPKLVKPDDDLGSVEVKVHVMERGWHGVGELEVDNCGRADRNGMG